MNLISFFPTVNKKPVTANSALENAFQEFFNADFPVSFRGGHLATSPAVNIAETADAYRIEVAAPGLDKGDFKVKVEGDLLSITAKREVKEEVNRGNYTRREFNYVSFQRNFHLPEQVDSNNIKANYENGILHVTLEKKQEAKPLPARVIEIG